MSGTQGRSGGPPPLAPPVDQLKRLATAMMESIASYEKASSPQEKSAALSKVQLDASKLSSSTTPLQQKFMDFTFRPYINAVARIAIEMNLFAKLPKDGSPISLADLAKACHAEEEFTLRIVRALAAHDVVGQTEAEGAGPPSYQHGGLSRMFEMPVGRAVLVHHFDNMLQAQTLSAGEFYSRNGFKSPSTAKEAAFGFAHGQQGKSIFDILEEQPARAKKLNDAMAIQGQIGLAPLLDAYPFDALPANADGIQLVDVGGGNGNTLAEILARFPSMRGKLVLQDLPSVLGAGGLVVSEPDVQLMAYDFFGGGGSSQPVQGANYLLKWVLHDWSDDECLQILRGVAAAMAPRRSRLLVVDLVLADARPRPDETLRDINMLAIGGKERAAAQWRELLGRGGFDIVETHVARGGFWTMIEAVKRDGGDGGA